MSTLDFTAIVADKAKGFVGREWVFQRIQDWLLGPSRIFLLAGGPGTGKSAIAARLAQLSDGSVADPAHAELAKGWLTYSHFCQAGLEGTISPLTFVQSLSEALANRYPESFGQALANTGSSQIVVNNVEQTVGTVHAGGHVTGVKLTLEIKGVDARPLFDLAVRKPAQALPAGERVVILIDSLDEALTFSAEDSITGLLRLVNDFPPQVRFICTARTHIARVTDAVGQPALDLIADAPPGIDDVKAYAQSRLKALAEPGRSALAERVAAKSNGNFLYAYYVLNGLEGETAAPEDIEHIELPDELDDVYRLDIDKKVQRIESEWSARYRPMLGAIAVARGEGLTRPQLIGITNLADDAAEDVLKSCAQYLVGADAADRPIRLYHQSFRDFLLQDGARGVTPSERHADVAGYMQRLCGSNWRECAEDYALRHTPAHWADAAALGVAQREPRTQTLIDLVRNGKYQRRFDSRIRDLPELQRHFERAVQVAALNGRGDMLPWLVKAARGLIAFRREYLRADAVAALAEAGELDQAEARLALFVDVDDDWITAARLILAWLSAEENPAAARKLHDRVAKGLAAIAPLPLLRDRLDAALRGQATFAFDGGFAPSLDYGRQLVNRISGQDFDRELLSSVTPELTSTLGQQSELIDQRGYAAYLDGPVLVHMAREHGDAGVALVDEYIAAHAGYNYVQYRNRSLWIVLHAVLRHHPDQAWVKRQLRQLLIAALSGGGVDFEEMLPLTAEALLQAARIREERGDASAREARRATVEARTQQALAAARALGNERGKNDLWGNHKRRLMALMELHALMLEDGPAARALFSEIQALPGGFAGFQAPADMRLADALCACGIDGAGEVKRALDAALRSSHHVQDYHFCARLTARCNALRRWHAMALAGEDLAAAVGRLAGAPHDAEFAADHVIGEAYQFRGSGPDTLSIEPARAAKTLEDLSEVFQRPAVEFRRLNPEHPLDQALAAGTPIRVPDPGFPPLLAVHLGAWVLADLASEGGRSALLRSLVPVAAASPTALDTMLSYLLIAADPEDVDLIVDIAREAGDVKFADVPVPEAQIGPDSPMAGRAIEAVPPQPARRLEEEDAHRLMRDEVDDRLMEVDDAKDEPGGVSFRLLNDDIDVAEAEAAEDEATGDA